MRHNLHFLVGFLGIALFMSGCGFGGASDSSDSQKDAEEGTAEACGNGICDSVEEAKGLCSQDCDGTDSPTESTSSDDQEDQQESQEELTLTQEEKEDLVDVTLAAYEEVDDVLAQLEEAVADGSQSQIDALVREIDTIAQDTQFQGIQPLAGTDQEFLSANESYRPAGSPWQRIKDAIAALDEGNQRVEFSYSFIIPGTDMENGKSLELKDQEDGSVSHEEFMQDISRALAAWEALYEQVFNTSRGYGGNLEIVFTNLGDETGTSFGSTKEQSAYELPNDENIGDLRYGMETYDSLVTGTPFSPSGSEKDGVGGASGDVHFNSNINWRTDSDSAANATSVLIVAAHETGHGLAFQHEEDELMFPGNIVRESFGELFPNGLIDDDAVVAAMVAMYGGGASTTSRSITTEDGITLSLPAVNAAALGVSAIKVWDAQEAIERVEAARDLLSDYKNQLN